MANDEQERLTRLLAGSTAVLATIVGLLIKAKVLAPEAIEKELEDLLVEMKSRRLPHEQQATALHLLAVLKEK